ncbi:MAG: MFS transporter, partial [Acidimicrobiales bacterium]
FTVAFSSLKVRDYRVLWWGGLFSFMSFQMQFLLRGLLAWDLTEREGALGLVYLSFGLAMLISTPLGGVATDRFDRRNILIASQGAILIAAVAMGALVLLGAAQFWMLLVAAMVQGGSFGFFGPARIALAADYVGRDQLGNAIALSLLSMNGTRIFAPALAGILAGVAFFGIGGAYLVAAVLSLASFGCLLALPPADRVAPAMATRNPLQDIADGVRYVRSRPPLRRLVVASFFIIMFGFNYVAFYPAMIEGVFGLDETWVGYISSASALGAVAVAVPLAGKADSPWAKTAMAIGGLAFGIGVVLFGISPSFWVAFVVIMMIGASTTVFQSLSNTLALNLSDEGHQGRVQSLMQLSFAGFGLAAAPLGFLAEVIGLRQAITIMGIVAVAATSLYVVFEGGFAALRPAESEPTGSESAGAGATVVNSDLSRAPATST